MESLTLATPEIQPQITTSTYQISYLYLGWEQQTITIGLHGQNGELKTFGYGGTTPDGAINDRAKAVTLMTALNKANLTVASLQKRVINQLIADGFMAGTVTGSPD